MTDVYDRSERFELLAACDGETLAGLADGVLDCGTRLRVLQEPTPRLVMQRVVEPVEKRRFNLGEVVVTAAEVELDGEKGFAMVPGKEERAALSGAILDAAVAAGHDLTDRIAGELRAAAAERDGRRRRRWAESRATAVEFEAMEDEG
ncbi:phosphonate C-P lyase system protein PhnG [Halegenticoccus soli]|uniref:phosphonate C-P lyase system protein PhnG n=1 Tax=Halegenticoccus soli TaxID=1985678 RepID=UPI000C6E93BA|nr:phosphonate C-P lyase system protein PhnG [Halegenticoccus soli]